MAHPTSNSLHARADERGMLLIEALVAMVIVATVTIAYIGIRTDALIDATRARNWRLAREIAEEHLTELMAGAHEIRPESGIIIPIDKYEGFSFKIVLGEAAVSEAEAEAANEAAGEDSKAREKNTWQQDRQDYQRAKERGQSLADYEETQLEDINDRLNEQAPSADEFEEVAVVVYFPKLDGDFPGQQETLLIKARVSTLAISGMTPEEAQTMQDAEGGGDTADPAASGAAAGFPGESGR